MLLPLIVVGPTGRYGTGPACCGAGVPARTRGGAAVAGDPGGTPATDGPTETVTRWTRTESQRVWCEAPAVAGMARARAIRSQSHAVRRTAWAGAARASHLQTHPRWGTCRMAVYPHTLCAPDVTSLAAASVLARNLGPASEFACKRRGSVARSAHHLQIWSRSRGSSATRTTGQSTWLRRRGTRGWKRSDTPRSGDQLTTAGIDQSSSAGTRSGSNGVSVRCRERTEPARTPWRRQAMTLRSVACTATCSWSRPRSAPT